MKSPLSVRSSFPLSFGLAVIILGLLRPEVATATDRLVFEPSTTSETPAKHIVLLAGDEEYRTEETMPMLAKILSKRHGFKCTVVFSMGKDGADYIDPNNSAGHRGLETLKSADLLLIGTRFRKPSDDQAQHVADFLNAGKPVIGIRTATHAFKGDGNFGGIRFDDFGLKILGETWVSHHGQHKKQGGRGVIEPSQASHPILRSVKDVFTPSDIYGVIHLTTADTILMRGAVTESLDPKSPNVAGEKNESLQPFAWLHTYRRPNGSGTGNSFCTTGGASVDFVNEDLRRLVVNAALSLTGREVPEKADVSFIDPFYPSFYGFIKEADYWKKVNMKPDDFGMGKAPPSRDPEGSPEWPYRELGKR